MVSGIRGHKDWQVRAYTVRLVLHKWGDALKCDAVGEKLDDRVMRPLKRLCNR